MVMPRLRAVSDGILGSIPMFDLPSVSTIPTRDFSWTLDESEVGFVGSPRLSVMLVAVLLSAAVMGVVGAAAVVEAVDGIVKLNPLSIMACIAGPVEVPPCA